MGWTSPYGSTQACTQPPMHELTHTYIHQTKTVSMYCSLQAGLTKIVVTAN